MVSRLLPGLQVILRHIHPETEFYQLHPLHTLEQSKMTVVTKRPVALPDPMVDLECSLQRNHLKRHQVRRPLKQGGRANIQQFSNGGKY